MNTLKVAGGGFACLVAALHVIKCFLASLLPKELWLAVVRQLRPRVLTPLWPV